MRDVNRLNKLYPKLLQLHACQCPDMRFTQLICAINNYIEKKYGCDPFYVEDKDYLKYAEEWFDNLQR